MSDWRNTRHRKPLRQRNCKLAKSARQEHPRRRFGFGSVSSTVLPVFGLGCPQTMLHGHVFDRRGLTRHELNSYLPTEPVVTRQRNSGCDAWRIEPREFDLRISAHVRLTSGHNGNLRRYTAEPKTDGACRRLCNHALFSLVSGEILHVRSTKPV